MPISQGHIYVMCIFSFYLYTKNHKITLASYHTFHTRTSTHLQYPKPLNSSRKKLKNPSLKLLSQPQCHLKHRHTFNLILLIWLSYPYITKQTHLTNHTTKAPHAHNYYTPIQSTHPTNIIQHMSHTHNTNISTIPPHTLTHHMPIPHHNTNTRTPSPHILINHIYNILSINHSHMDCYIEYHQWILSILLVLIYYIIFFLLSRAHIHNLATLYTPPTKSHPMSASTIPPPHSKTSTHTLYNSTSQINYSTK